MSNALGFLINQSFLLIKSMKALIPKSQVCLSYQLSRPVETEVNMLQTFQCLKVLCFCVMLESTDQSNTLITLK